jgi:hypothetical protein
MGCMVYARHMKDQEVSPEGMVFLEMIGFSVKRESSGIPYP